MPVLALRPQAQSSGCTAARAGQFVQTPPTKCAQSSLPSRRLSDAMGEIGLVPTAASTHHASHGPSSPRGEGAVTVGAEGGPPHHVVVRPPRGEEPSAPYITTVMRSLARVTAV